MEYKYIFLLGFISNFIFAQNNLPNIGDKDFKLDVDFYNTNNNFARFGVKIKDGFLVAGQNFVKENNLQHNSAVVKLSKDGKIIKETFLGSDFSDENGSSIKTLFDIGKNRYLQVGEKNKKLWLRKIDDDLNVLKDSVYTTVPASTTYSPYVFNFKDDVLVITKSSYYRDIELNITTLKDNLRITENNVIKFPGNPFNFCEIYNFSCMMNSADSKLYISVNACVEKGFDSGNKTNAFLIEYDLNSKQVTRTVPLDVNFTAEQLIENNKLIYIAGEQNDPNIPPGSKSIYKKTSIKVYSQDFQKIKDFNFEKNKDDDFNELIYDAVIADNKIQVVGELYHIKQPINEAFLLTFDLDGSLLEKRTFKKGPLYTDNWIRKIIPLENNQYLLLGKGNNGWRVIIK